MIKNAVITAAQISKGDHNLLDCWLDLDYGDSSGQGFGGYALYLPKSFKNHELLLIAGHHLFRILEIAGVDRWSDLKGRSIRVRTDSDSAFGGLIEAIGHIVKDDWFCPSEDYAHLKGGSK